MSSSTDIARMLKDVKDPESLNMPDDSAHNAYNATTLKNADDVDEDGHHKRTGAPTLYEVIQLGMSACWCEAIKCRLPRPVVGLPVWRVHTVISSK